jgi:tetratricopeptide (TPR) repeat protein
MIRTEVRLRIFFSLILLLSLAISLVAQSDESVDPADAAQARSEEEFDLYLEVVTAPDPHQVIDKVDIFALQFPHSELLSGAYQCKMRACEELNDFACTLDAGRKALLGNPNDVHTLLTLASAMASRAPGRPDRDQLLSQAAEDANLALAQIDATRLSRKVSLQEWTEQKRQLQSEAHGALGLVALQRKQNSTAVQELSTSIRLSTQPTGIQFLRLGLALNSIASTKEAEDNFRQAAELGPDPVRSLALRELKVLSEKNFGR